MPSDSLLRFGIFELHVERQELRRNGAQVVLAPQPCRVLAYLAQRPGEVVTREELRQHLWGEDTYVEADVGLNSCIRKIRRALRDDAQSPRFIETLPKRGYLFLAAVEASGESSAAPARPARKLRPVAVIGALVLVVGAVLAAAWSVRTGGASVEPGKAMQYVAVAPIQDLRGEEPTTRFSAGLTEELLLRLARRLPAGVAVLDTSSAQDALDGGEAPEFLLRCSIRGDDAQLRLIARLVRGGSGESVWTDEFDVALGDELEAQERIATSAAAALAGELQARVAAHSAPQLRWASESTTPAASEAYLNGLYLILQGGRDELDRAIDFLEQAIALDPELAVAHGALARAYNGQVFSGSVSPAEGFAQARTAAHRALRHDPALVDALVSLGYVQLYSDRDLEAAHDSLSRARDLAPGFARPHSALASLWAVAQRHRRAVAEARLARDLDPMGLSVNADLCWYLVYADRFDEAIVECERSLELAPTNQWTLLGLAEAQLASGDEPSAIQVLRRATGLPEEGPQSVAGIWSRVRTALEARGSVDAFMLATVTARSGDSEAALAALEQAAREESFWMVYLRVDPRLDSLHGMAPFETLASAMGLPAEPSDEPL